MADENQAQADPAKPSTVAEPNPAPAPVSAPVVPAAASPTPNPSPASVDPNGVDFDKVDGETYAKWRESLATIEQPGKPAAEAAPAPPAPAAAVPAAPVVDTTAPAPDEDQMPQPGKDFRPRLGKLPPVEQEAIILRRQLSEQGQEVPLKECIARVEAKYQTAPPDPNAPPPKAERTPEEIEAQIATLKVEKKDAANNADTLKYDDIVEQIEALRAEQADTRTKIAERQHSQASQFDRDVAGAKARAIQFYPDAADKNTALGLKIAEVAERLHALDDPLMRDPLSPFKVTQMAAAELGIAPIDPKAPKVSPPTLPVSTQPSRPMQPAPGALRSAPPAAATGQLEERLASVSSLDDYENMREQVFAGAR